MRHAIAGALAGALIVGSAATATARTYITVSWEGTTLSQSACLDQAERAIRAGGFQTLPHTERSRHGFRGEYTALVQCAADKNFVIFTVAGPDPQLSKQYYDAIAGKF